MRLSEDVFHPAAIDSAKGMDVTQLHPPIFLFPRNSSIYQKGHVGDDVAQDDEGSVSYMSATIYVRDSELRQRIVEGEFIELSCGYYADFEESPGTTEDGQAFDGYQRNIRLNHVAVGPKSWGRGGPEVRLALDSKDDAVLASMYFDNNNQPNTSSERGREKGSMEDFTIEVNGVPMTFKADSAMGKAICAHVKNQEQKISESEKLLSEEKARADAAERKESAVKAELAVANDPKERAKQVRQRSELMDQCRLIAGPEFKSDESDTKAMIDALKTANIDVAEDVDGKDATYTDAFVSATFKREVRSIDTEKTDDIKGSFRKAHRGLSGESIERDMVADALDNI
jgi:hypothetical protein